MNLEEKLKAEEIKQVAIDESQQDWDDLAFRQVSEEGFIKGANWAKTKLISICQEAVDEACKNAKIEECKYWQNAIFSPQSIIAQLSVIDFQLRIAELESPSPKEKL